MKSGKCLILALFLLTLTVTSCKKDEVAKTKREILTSHTWKWFSARYNDTNIPVPPCIVDNVLTFSANGTFTESTGAIKCSPDEPDATGSWSLSADEKTFTWDGDTFAFEINESQMILKLTEGAGITTLTFVSL